MRQVPPDAEPMRKAPGNGAARRFTPGIRLAARQVFAVMLTAFAYVGFVFFAMTVSVASWTPALAVVWDQVEEEQRQALTRNIAGFPRTFLIVVTVCMIARFVLRASGIPWHLFAGGIVIASCGGFTVWASYVIGELRPQGWAVGVPTYLSVVSPVLVVVGASWLVIRRVGRPEVPPSVSSGAEEGMLPRWNQ